MLETLKRVCTFGLNNCIEFQSTITNRRIQLSKEHVWNNRNYLIQHGIKDVSEQTNNCHFKSKIIY